MRSLLIETNAVSKRAVASELPHDQGWSLECAADAVQALRMFERDAHSLVMITARAGCQPVALDLCTKIRRRSAAAALIVEANPDAIEDAFNAGADDVVVAPYTARELVARARAVMRRAGSAGEHPPARAAVGARLVTGAIVVDLLEQKVTVDGAPVELTRTQFHLLTCLMRHADATVSQDVLRAQVLRSQIVIETSSIRNHIYKLKSRLGPARHSIEAVRGEGYRLGALTRSASPKNDVR